MTKTKWIIVNSICAGVSLGVAAFFIVNMPHTFLYGLVTGCNLGAAIINVVAVHKKLNEK